MPASKTILFPIGSRVFVPTWGVGTVDGHHGGFFGTEGHWVKFDGVDESKLCMGTHLSDEAANS